MGENYAHTPIDCQAHMPTRMRFNAHIMKTLAERIYNRRKILKISQQKLGDLVGLDQTVISKLERGDVQETSKIAELAFFLGVNPLWLSSGKGEMLLKSDVVPITGNENNVTKLLETITLRGRVPLISLVAAGNWSEAVDNYQPGYAEDWINTTIPTGNNTFALRVEGDSMEPEFPPGMIIVVEPDMEPQAGDYVIAKNGSDATFKQLIKDGADWYLKPLNQRYPVKLVQEGTQIVGVVREVIRRLR